MSKQTVDIGQFPNDGNGDPLRVAMDKVNDNFNELYNTVGDGSTVSTLATVAFSGDYDDLTNKPSGGGGGSTTFIGLTDTPGAFGSAGQILQVNSGATALEFVNAPSGGGSSTFIGLTDTPGSFGTAGQYLRVNSGATALEFATLSGGGGASAFTDLTDVTTAGITLDEVSLSATTTYVLTANGSSAYRIDQFGVTDNPTIYVRAGQTVAFQLDAVSSHPLLIQTSGGSNYDTGLVHYDTDGTKTTGSAAQGKTSGTLYWKVPSSISGTYSYQCSVHGSMQGDIEVEAVAGASGGGSLPSRTTATGTTASIADGASDDLDITGFKAYALLAIETDRAAWVRLYTDDASRTADASRGELVDPLPDAGVIAEVITGGAETVKISPGALGFNFESSPTTTIPAAVTNKSGGTSTVQVTLTLIQMES